MEWFILAIRDNLVMMQSNPPYSPFTKWGKLAALCKGRLGGFPDRLVKHPKLRQNRAVEETNMGVLTEDMKRMVREQRLAFVATVCADGTPNLSPKGTIAVWDDDHLIFADLASPGTMENLRNNPAIEINVVDAFLRKGYRFKGTATIPTAGASPAASVQDYLGPDRGIRTNLSASIRDVVLIKVEHAAPLVSPAYDSGAEEVQVRNQWEEHWQGITDGFRGRAAKTS